MSSAQEYNVGRCLAVRLYVDGGAGEEVSALYVCGFGEDVAVWSCRRFCGRSRNALLVGCAYGGEDIDRVSRLHNQ